MRKIAVRAFGSRSWLRIAAVMVVCLATAPVVVMSAAHADPAVPTLTVTPSTNLADGQSVEVSGTGFVPGAKLDLAQCLTDTPFPFHCGLASGGFPPQLAVDPVTVGGDGSFTRSFSVKRTILVVAGAPTLPPNPRDCVTGCEIRVLDPSASVDSDRVAGASISLTALQLDTTIVPVATLDAATNMLVFEAVLSCNTPVLSLTVEGGISAANVISLIGGACAVDSPLLAFFTATSSTPLSPGPASASICVYGPNTDPSVPELSCPITGSVTTAQVQVLDYASLKAAIDTLRADPANTELRAAIARAIRARIAEDAVYRRQFFAELAAG